MTAKPIESSDALVKSAVGGILKYGLCLCGGKCGDVMRKERVSRVLQDEKWRKSDRVIEVSDLLGSV